MLQCNLKCSNHTFFGFENVYIRISDLKVTVQYSLQVVSTITLLYETQRDVQGLGDMVWVSQWTPCNECCVPRLAVYNLT